MKYVIIIPDGAADFPSEELGDKTPLESARLPNLARVAAIGRVGAAVTTPEEFEAGSDVCSMSLLGYDPRKYHSGRAPLEAAALGITTGPTDTIFRLNLVTTGLAHTPEAGVMQDHSAGAITSAEARVLVTDLMEFWKAREPDLTREMTLTSGVSYRNILVDASDRNYKEIITTPPHSIPGEPWAEHLPRGGGVEPGVLKRLMELSAEFLPTHEVNQARAAQGLRMATMAWIWGQGVRAIVPTFRERFGMRGAMITSVDVLAGIASYLEWERLKVPGLTRFHDTDYAGLGRATVRAIDQFDVVCSHVEAPDELSHQGDWKRKVESLEAIDKHIIGPVFERLESFGDPDADSGVEGWRLLIMPSHYTLCETRKHDATPVPMVMAGAWITSAVERPFSEEAALESDLRVDPGHELMEYFLRGGLAAVRGVRKRGPAIPQ